MSLASNDRQINGNTPAHQVERYVRGKTSVYRKWRKGRKWPKLDNLCTECLFRFGPLPRWEEYVQARRTRDWTQAELIERHEHRAWKHQVRDWCMEREIVSYRNEASAFIKYYFAWYRWQHEERHGKIERKYGRQMS